MSVLPTFFKGLTPEVEHRAEVELNETPRVREKALIQFKKLIGEQQDIYCNPDELFLLRFLRMKKFKVQKALKVLRNYYNHRKKHAGVITCLKPSDVKKAIEMNITFYCPYRLPNGSHVVIFRIGAYNPSDVTAEEALATLFICGELVLECEAAHICGANLLVDFSNCSFQHYKQFITLSFAKFTLDALQESWPGRTKGVHFINEPFALHALINVVKHIGKKKLMDRVYCHGNNLSSLHEHIPQEYLPEDLGGRLGSQEYKKFASYVFSQESVLEKMNKYGIIN